VCAGIGICELAECVDTGRYLHQGTDPFPEGAPERKTSQWWRNCRVRARNFCTWTDGKRGRRRLQWFLGHLATSRSPGGELAAAGNLPQCRPRHGRHDLPTAPSTTTPPRDGLNHPFQCDAGVFSGRHSVSGRPHGNLRDVSGECHDQAGRQWIHARLSVHCIGQASQCLGHHCGRRNGAWYRVLSTNECTPSTTD